MAKPTTSPARTKATPPATKRIGLEPIALTALEGLVFCAKLSAAQQSKNATDQMTLAVTIM